MNNNSVVNSISLNFIKNNNMKQQNIMKRNKSDDKFKTKKVSSWTKNKKKNHNSLLDEEISNIFTELCQKSDTEIIDQFKNIMTCETSKSLHCVLKPTNKINKQTKQTKQTKINKPKIKTYNKINKQNISPDPVRIRRNTKSFNNYLTKKDIKKTTESHKKIEGTYKFDFNINSIHNIILNKFDNQKINEIYEIKKKLKQEKENSTSFQTIIERKKTLKTINELQKILDDILSNKLFNEYIEKIKPLIDDYNIIGSLSKIVSFAKNKRNNDIKTELPEDKNVQYKRQDIITDFLEIARKYVDIDIVRDMYESDKCKICNLDIDENYETDEFGVSRCHCGYEKSTIVRSPFCKDTTRVNNSRSNYEDRKNFYKAILRYQGKQPDKPPNELYIVLDKYFYKHQKPKIKLDSKLDSKPVFVSPKYIRNNLKLNDEGEKEGTSRWLMNKALKETGNSTYYDHINIILHIFWGWKLDDISHLEDVLMKDYDKLQPIYESIDKDRKSSLNGQFKLYKQLKERNHSCNAKNFKMPTTPDIVEFNNIIWSKMKKIYKKQYPNNWKSKK